MTRTSFQKALLLKGHAKLSILMIFGPNIYKY